MTHHEQPARLRVGQVAARTGLSVRTLHYYDELGLVRPSERLAGGHRVYAPADVERLYRVCVLRRLGRSLSEIAALLDAEDLRGTLRRHLDELDARLSALGRQRERVVAAQASLAGAEPTDRDLLALLEGVGDTDAGLRQRITLLVYEDIEAAHDHLVTMFGFGPGMLTRDADGKVVHGELHVGAGVVWMHPPSPAARLVSPRAGGVSTHCMAVMVDDVDRHYANALAAGAEVTAPPRDQPYGVREYDALDCEGGLWSFMTSLEDLTQTSPSDDPD